jgi:TRAP-type mannitol/chloroaromatic compound transport system permease small subunit
MTKFIDRVTEWLAESSGWLVSIIMILLVIDFVSRGLSKPIQGVGEMAVFVMVAVVYLGLGHCEQEKGHVRVEMFITKMPPKLLATVNFLCYFLGLTIITFLIYSVFINAVSSFQEHEAVAGPTPLPIFPVKFVIAFGLVFYWFQIGLNMMEALGKLLGKGPIRR